MGTFQYCEDSLVIIYTMDHIATLTDENNQPIPCRVIFSAKRKRSIGMTVNRTGVTVRAPKNCSKKLIQQFIDAKEAWIVKQWAKQKRQDEISTIEYDDN